ncbi:MAG: glycosyltransferase family 2 protein [Nitrospirae bacterium]|nr:glycosyltransferase family 2 protein [Nitrospirota bacterium]
MTCPSDLTVSVIVLNYNGKHLLEECMESLFSQSCPPLEIIVVDNGSTDGSVPYLEERYGTRIRLIRNSANLGFAEGNNIGIAAAAGSHIALLNNDAVADRRWLEGLVSAAQGSDSTFGMWASKILFYDRRDMIDTAGHLIYPDGLNRGRGKNEIDRGQYDLQEEIFFPSGCAALYAKMMLDEIDAFDPDFFAYGDDTDLGLKARLAGWKCLFVPASVVYHRSSATAGTYSPFKAYLVERNRVWVLIKYFPFTDILLSPWYTLVRLTLTAYAALTGRGAAGRFIEGSSAPGLMKVLFRAYADALRKLPLMIQKRRDFRPRIRTTVRDFHKWLRKYKISAAEISLKD